MVSTVISKEQTRALRVPILGCGLLILGAWIKFPFYPVPLTLHTFALFLLALTQSPRQAFYSTSLYLVLATMGIPVFFLHSNPFWWVGKCGGYLWAFPMAAYGMAKLRAKVGNLLALVLGSLWILLCGFAWLIPFVGPSMAWKQGLLVFIPSELVKILVASTLIKWRRT